LTLIETRGGVENDVELDLADDGTLLEAPDLSKESFNKVKTVLRQAWDAFEDHVREDQIAQRLKNGKGT